MAGLESRLYRIDALPEVWITFITQFDQRDGTIWMWWKCISTMKSAGTDIGSDDEWKKSAFVSHSAPYVWERVILSMPNSRLSLRVSYPSTGCWQNDVSLSGFDGEINFLNECYVRCGDKCSGSHDQHRERTWFVMKSVWRNGWVPYAPRACSRLRFFGYVVRSELTILENRWSLEKSRAKGRARDYLTDGIWCKGPSVESLSATSLEER